MRKGLINFICLAAGVCLLALSITGCYGRFGLTRKIYQVNGSIGDKWLNSIFTWIMLPAYGICGALDLALFNVIQFWTGRNPIALGPGEQDTQLAFYDGRVVEITASQNRFDLMTRDDAGNTIRAGLVYDPRDNTWYAEQPDAGNVRVARVATIEGGEGVGLLDFL